MNAVWTLTNVSLSGSPRPRLAEVTVDIPAGVTVVLGYSGAGKTSLLNLLVDFERPTQGQVRFVPPDTSRLPRFWVPQDDGLWPHLSTQDHLTRVLPRPAAGQVVTARSADDWLSLFDLQSVRHTRPDELSQGERSRLSVARALAADPAVLVMDEPLVHVDPARAPAWWQVISEWQKTTSATLVIATHLPEIALGLADQVLCLAEGRIIWSGPPRELYERPPSAQLAGFLGPVNWLTKEELELCGLPLAQIGYCVRPEQIVVERSDVGPFCVQHSQFLGTIARTVLVHAATDRTLCLAHRPSRASLQPGDTAVVRLPDV